MFRESHLTLESRACNESISLISRSPVLTHQICISLQKKYSLCGIWSTKYASRGICEGWAGQKSQDGAFNHANPFLYHVELAS